MGSTLLPTLHRDTHSSRPGKDWLGLGSKPSLNATIPPWSGKDAGSRLSAALLGSTELKDCVAYSYTWAWGSAEGPTVETGFWRLRLL